jgi:hypothetical protein
MKRNTKYVGLDRRIRFTELWRSRKSNRGGLSAKSNRASHQARAEPRLDSRFHRAFQSLRTGPHSFFASLPSIYHLCSAASFPVVAGWVGGPFVICRWSTPGAWHYRNTCKSLATTNGPA